MHFGVTRILWKGGRALIRRNQAFLNRINVLLDFLLIVCAYILATWFWLDIMGGRNDNMAALNGKTIFLTSVYAFILVFSLTLLGFYSTTRTRRLVWKIQIIFILTSVTLLFTSTLFYLFRLTEFSRGVLGCFYFFVLIILIGKYTCMRLVFNRMRANGYNLKHIIVIGTGDLARQFAIDAANERSLGLHIKGFVGPAGRISENYIGDYSQLECALASPDINEAVIALDPDEYIHIRDLIAVCEKNGVKYYIIPFYNDIIPANPVIETIGESKLINMRSNRLENVGWAGIKRGFDFIASGLGLVILSPLLLCIAIGVKLSSPGPILFRQKRVGYERQEFNMLKFRSMKVNSKENTGWTTNADDRRTRFGTFIRKFSLDELPQLWNVFKGDMSLIGPRPELPHFVDQFKETIPFYMVKHQVRPGITGWAQINGYRGDTSIQKRIELDLWYIEHWSVGLDVEILFKTLFGGMINKEKLYDLQKKHHKQNKGTKQF